MCPSSTLDVKAGPERIDTAGLSGADAELVEAARLVLVRHYRPFWHMVSAALRGTHRRPCRAGHGRVQGDDGDEREERHRLRSGQDEHGLRDAEAEDERREGGSCRKSP